MGRQLYRFEAIREPRRLTQRFQYQKFGHSAKEWNNAVRCLGCSHDHSVNEYKVQKANAKFSNCGVDHATLYRGYPAYQQKLADILKKMRINTRVIAYIFKPQADGEVPPNVYPSVLNTWLISWYLVQ